MLSIYQEHYKKQTKIVHTHSKSKQQNISEREKQFKTGALHQFPDSQSFLPSH